MAHTDWLVFWGVIALLCLASLIRARDITLLLKCAWDECVRAWKFQPWIPHIAGVDTNSKRPMRIGSGDEGGTGSQVGRKSIFPRSRRNA